MPINNCTKREEKNKAATCFSLLLWCRNENLDSMCPRCYAWPSLYMYDCTCCCNFFLSCRSVSGYLSTCVIFLEFSSSSSCAGLMAISFVSLTSNKLKSIYTCHIGRLIRIVSLTVHSLSVIRERERDFPQWTFCCPKLFRYKIRPKNNSEHKKKFYRTPKKGGIRWPFF